MENTVEAIKKIIGEPRNYGIETLQQLCLSLCCLDRAHTRGEGTDGGRGEEREGV